MRLILPLLSCLCLFSLGQTINNHSAAQRGNEVVVSYQLDGEKGKAYTISLYASNNNFTTALRAVEGDVATKRVLPGTNKTIKWRVLDELKNFDADISFEIRAVVAPPLFSKITPSATKVKRGKQISITWTGGNPRNEIVVELIKGDKNVPAGTLANGDSLLYSVPKKMKTGKYLIQLTQSGEWAQGGEFIVKPKYPLWMKAAPLVLGVAIIKFWPQPEKFPEPPDLTGN